ncbi:MAG: molybdopterin-dependent oxidoreductase [Deltaproteobacteria bacterium]|nr:molybdopterin-dependent oxidoreductase [Deltaproteobacteria bacterium]
MEEQGNVKEIRGYCSMCSCWCPTVSIVKDGVFVEVKPDHEHPLGHGICPKGLAGPELVYNKQRLQYPMRRTNPKDNPDPGWERITWDEALDTIVKKLKDIMDRFGPEAIAVARSGPAGSPMGELGIWVTRFANAIGTPNCIATTHICQWHRDCGSAFTYGNIGRMHSAGRPEFERSACIMIWGNNMHATRSSLLPFVRKALDKGASLIVIDPRRTGIADLSDIWLQVLPGTDGALALGMINEAIEKGFYDSGFVRDWTTAPFLVRSDTGDFLSEADLEKGGATSTYAVMVSEKEGIKFYTPGNRIPVQPVLDVTTSLRLADGKEVECSTVFRLLRKAVSEYTLAKTEELTGVPREKISNAVKMFFTRKPSCWYSWNGVEQSINATQTNRAICILYALTGNYDAPGGNVLLKGPEANPVIGHELLSPEADAKRLGSAERPLGPGGIFKSTQAYEVYRAILTGKPYPVKGMIGFGGNLIMSNAPSEIARKAIARLDFHVQAELFLSPTAQLADIVLPAASCWESWHVGASIGPLGDKAYVQLRPAVVEPRYECWPDMKIIFELAKRMGRGDVFWDGDIGAAFDFQFAPSGITVDQLRANPGGITVDLPLEYRKYSKTDEKGNLLGFPTPSKRIEIYSSIFKAHGYDPLPSWKDQVSFCFPGKDISKNYPLILINGKVIEYCHSQHRSLPSLRKRVPHPFLEIHSQKAREVGCKDGDRVILETPYGSITLLANITDSIAYDVVCTQNGWWDACHELNLPGYDPYGPGGANVNILYSTDIVDPISGSLPIKGYPCNVRKA